jgi:mannose-6-phosphate isomerase-like protein (cupin superfamily)
MVKDECWYVEEGNFLYRWIDTETADIHENMISEGDIVRQRPGQPHQLEAIEDGRIFEVSTHHENSDSYRVQRGDSQNE